MEKNVKICFVSFIAVFTLLFLYLQPVFIPKYNETLSIRQFYNEPEDSLDVIIIGTSDMRSAVLSPVLWEEAGIKSYNLSMFDMYQINQYYVLKEVLRYQTPSVVVMHGESLFEYIDYDTNYSEGRFRQSFDLMRWSSVKIEGLRDILSRSERQSFAEYLFPLLRYHDRDDITAEDFDFSVFRKRNAVMGSYRDKELRTQPMTFPGDYRHTGEIPEIYDDYLSDMVEMCKERGIEIVFIHAPVCDENILTAERIRILQDFTAMHGLYLIDFSDPQLFEQIGMDASADFCDPGHTNISGGTKVSRYLARHLRDNYAIPDHRAENSDAHWDDVMEYYNQRYALWEAGNNK